MEKPVLHIIKIGGNVIDDKQALFSFLMEFALLNEPKILVHGGGILATRLAEQLAIPTQMYEGRRVTDEESLKIVTMVYAGLINKQIVAQLQAQHCNAIGLSGADANVIPATRRNPVPVDFGFVGDVAPSTINASFLENLIQQGIAPVCCAITHDQKGSLLNSNADTVAAALAIALSAHFETHLIFCFEKEGVLSNTDDTSSLIPEITRVKYQELKENKLITGGMIPKIDNAYKAIDAGVKKVIIKHARNLKNTIGTIIVD